MSKPKYIIEIDEEGGITITGCGFKGKGCKLPDAMLAELGQVTSSKKLPEWYAAQTTVEKVTVGK